MDLLLKDKAAIVTGGSKGIGEGIVRSLAKEGCRIAILSRPSKEGSQLTEELQTQGKNVIFVEAELTDYEICKNAVQKVVNTFGQIDILVNNAGVNDGVKLSDSIEAFEKSLHKNLVQVFAITHYCLEHLKKTTGVIINIGSKVSETGQGDTSGYAASKGGVNALTREWAVSLKEFSIRVNTVIPAEVMTPLYRNWLNTFEDPDAELQKITDSIPLAKRMTTSEEIADMTTFLASPKSAHTTGQIIYVDGGYTHLDRKCTL